MGVIVMPVYTPFLIARGLTAGDVLSLQAVFGVAVMLFEIPTGYFCDVAGRRRTILIGAVLNLLGLAAFVAVRGFAAYAAVEVLLAAGLSLVSGADIALIYELLDLDDAGRDARRRALGRYVLAQVLGEAAAALLGGALAAVSLRAVGWACVAEATLPVLIALRLPRSAPTATGGVTVAGLSRGVRTVFSERGRVLLFANLVVWSLSTFIAVWLVQPYWQEQRVGLRWFGLLWAGTLVTVALTSHASHTVTRRLGQRGVTMVLAVAPVVAYAGMAWLGGAAGIACGFLFYVSRGFTSVNLTEAFNHGLPSHLRATFNSLSSGAFRLSYAVCGPVIGSIMDHAGLDHALAALAVVFLAAFGLLAVPLMRHQVGVGFGSA